MDANQWTPTILAVSGATSAAIIRPGLYQRIGAVVGASVSFSVTFGLLGGTYSVTLNLPLPPVTPASANLNGYGSYVTGGPTLNDFQVGVVGSPSSAAVVVSGQVSGLTIISTVVTVTVGFQYLTTSST